MKRWLNLLGGVLIGLFMVLALPPAVQARDDGPWQLTASNTPEVLTLTEGIRETLVQVVLTRTAEITADRVVVYCTKPAGGQIISVTEPAIPIRVAGEIQAIVWSGPVMPTETVALSYTVSPSGALESLGMACRLFETGTLQSEITLTVPIVPWHTYFALAFKKYAVPVLPEVSTIIDWDTWAGMDQNEQACTNPAYLQLWSDVPGPDVMAGWLNYDGYKYEVFRSFMRFTNVSAPGKIVSGSITLNSMLEGIDGSQIAVGLWTGAYPPPTDAWAHTDQYIIPITAITVSGTITQPGELQDFQLPQAAIDQLKVGRTPIFLIKLTIENLPQNQFQVVPMSPWMIPSNPVRLNLFKRSP